MDNTQFKNDYFAKKEAKEKEAGKRESQKNLKKIVLWLAAAVVIALAAWTLKGTLKTADVSEVKGEYFPAQSREHIAVGQAHAEYSSNPPTGGWHYDTPAQTGIYDKELPDEQLIHNLEHGHIWISYKPDLDPQTIEKLADIAKSYSSKIIMAPRAKNDKPIALSAWEYLLKLDTFDEEQILGFIKAHRGKGPENIPDFGFGDFRENKK